MYKNVMKTLPFVFTIMKLYVFIPILYPSEKQNLNKFFCVFVLLNLSNLPQNVS